MVGVYYREKGREGGGGWEMGAIPEAERWLRRRPTPPAAVRMARPELVV